MTMTRSRFPPAAALLALVMVVGALLDRLFLVTSGMVGGRPGVAEAGEFWQPAAPSERAVRPPAAWANRGGAGRRASKPGRRYRARPNEVRNGKPPREKLPYFLHIHKSGGTTVCTMAKANGEVVPPNNCNQIGDGPHTLDQFPSTLSLNCQERYDRATESGYTFVAIERFLAPGELDCRDHFLYVLVVRDPVARAVSHADVHSAGVGNKPHIQAHYSEDNYMTRTLMGESGFNGDLPPDSINGMHADVAKRAIDKFDVVLCLEEFDSDAVQLEHTLGWSQRVGAVNVRKRGGIDVTSALRGKSEGAGRGGKTSAAFASLLKDKNAIDYDVYRYACERAHILSGVAREQMKLRS